MSRENDGSLYPHPDDVRDEAGEVILHGFEFYLSSPSPAHGPAHRAGLVPDYSRMEQRRTIYRAPILDRVAVFAPQLPFKLTGFLLDRARGLRIGSFKVGAVRYTAATAAHTARIGEWIQIELEPRP